MPYSFHQTLAPVVRGEAPQKLNALILDEKEWNELKYNLKWKEHEAAAMATAMAWRKSIKDKSDNIKKTWKDTVANIRQKQLDAREARFQAYIDERMERFRETQREKQEEKRLYLEACDRLMFYNKDSVKSLNKAMVFSEVLRERALQVEFDKKLADIEKQREAEYAAKVKQDVANYEEEERVKKEAKQKRLKEYQTEILTQLRERDEKEKAKKKKTQQLEREDMENLRKEMELGDRIGREALAVLRQDVRKNVLEAMEHVQACKEAKKVEDDEEDRVIAVYAEAKARIARMCKQREKDIQDEALRLREKIREKLGAEAKAKQDNEEEQLRKQIEKRDAEDERVRKEKEAYQKRMVKERKENHHEYLEAEKRRKEEERQMRKWEMLQRFRTEEVNEAHAQRKQEKREAGVVARREELAKQIAVNESLKDGLRPEDIYAMEQAFWKKEDDAFFKYADEILEESRQVGRPLMPIERAIYQYRVENGLLPRKIVVNPELKSSIPFGRAKDKSHMPAKRSRLRKKQNTIPDGQCTCGPILCSCPPVFCLSPMRPNTIPDGQCTCGPILCACAPPVAQLSPKTR